MKDSKVALFDLFQQLTLVFLVLFILFIYNYL